MMASSGKATVTLPAPNQILITREFDAPKDLVYRAWTEPELVRQWWCGERGEMTLCEIDLRVGGMWRYVMIASSGGFEVAFHGEYKEIVENERIVSTEAYEGLPEGMDPDEEASLNTATLTEVDGRTTLTTLVEHRTQEGRDMHINSGMEGGMNEAMDRLERVAISLA
ncbi:MAG: hypothetical protein QOG62_2632 [Thermoleophilaceae bacterium]|nr:hypothetical protein [Thermoleophilaceae bacterium]